MSTTTSSPCKKLLIFGATGLIGSRITRELVRRKSHFDRIAIFTSKGTSETKADELSTLKGQGVEIIVGDITIPKDVVKAYAGIDTVISCVGRNVIEHQVELVRLADESTSVHRFFPSEYGTDIEYGPASAGEKPHQKKLKVRAAIRACKNLDFTYVVVGPYADGEPGLYFGASKIQDMPGFDAQNRKAVLLGDGKLPVSFTTMKDTGKLVALAVINSEASRNKALRVNSFTTTDSEIVKEFEKQTGGHPWEISYTSIQKLKTLEDNAWAAEKPWATGFTLRRIWAEGGTIYNKRDNEIIQAEHGMETLAEAVTEAIKVQRSQAKL